LVEMTFESVSSDMALRLPPPPQGP
jgi:hypothetical protein